ncbi:josephin-like protein [Coffea arabica]|uniref:Josephin-like protein n=1 Tax=Coffea arabica TaxID=13443 RepID=A0ABM4VB47_COFAR
MKIPSRVSMYSDLMSSFERLIGYCQAKRRYGKTRKTCQLYFSTAKGNGRANNVGSHATVHQKPAAELQKQKSCKKEDNTPRCTRSCKFRLPRKKELSPLKYLKHIGGKMFAVLQMMSPRRCSPKVTSSERAKPSVAPVDSHRAEAIDDCIEFINSSSSLPRSNSTLQ